MFSLLKVTVSPECLCQPHLHIFQLILLVIRKPRLLGVKNKLKCKSFPPPQDEAGENEWQNWRLAEALTYSFFFFFFFPLWFFPRCTKLCHQKPLDLKDDNTEIHCPVTVNPWHMKKAFKVMNELRRYYFTAFIYLESITHFYFHLHLLIIIVCLLRTFKSRSVGDEMSCIYNEVIAEW